VHVVDPTVVLRVESMDGDVERFRKVMMGRYWRGRSLSRYTGGGWEAVAERSVLHRSTGQNLTLLEKPADVRIAVFREASDHAYIFVPDGLSQLQNIASSVEFGDQGGIRFMQSPNRRLRIVMSLHGRETPSELLRAPVSSEKDIASIPLSVLRWAEEVAGTAASDEGKLGQLIGELHDWEYALNASIDSADPIASFIRSKRGHCELYASTLALAARSLGIPARVVNGYSGGEWNEMGGFYLVRQQHAHSWVEAWIDGHWRQFDPTPSSRWQLSGVSFPALDEIWESVKLSWYRYVLEFQDSDKAVLFKNITVLLKQYLAWVIVVLMVGLALVWLRKSGLTRLKSLFAFANGTLLDRWLHSHGVERKPFQPLRHLPTPSSVDAKAWQQFVFAWESQHYGTAQHWSRWELKRHLRAL